MADNIDSPYAFEPVRISFTERELIGFGMTVERVIARMEGAGQDVPRDLMHLRNQLVPNDMKWGTQ